MPNPVLRVLDEDRVLNALPDPLDFRDQMYVPSLVYVAPQRTLHDFFAACGGKENVEVLNQRSEGACTGFALAAVANYLLRTSKVKPPATAVPEPHAKVSARMLYEMARRYDEWAGEDYSGSSARGAMKGWHKHGVCTWESWEYAPGDAGTLTKARAEEARQRPLGAYYRVNHRDLVAMHAALAEVGILYATSRVHAGWRSVGADGIIRKRPNMIGGHAFAIVAYDDAGFWVQNSWGPKWGKDGFCKVSYDDWLENGSDVWVARLGVPVSLTDKASVAILQAAGRISSPGEQQHELRPHIISLGNDGQLRTTGAFGTSEADVKALFEHDITDRFNEWKGKPRRLLLYAHGGLVSEQSAVQRVSEYLPTLLANHIYPLAFSWKSDYWTTITNILQDALKRQRPEGVLDAAKDFLLDRADDALEPLARALTGRAAWKEMKENAERASLPAEGRRKAGGARVVAAAIKALRDQFPDLEVHLVAHSAGSILFGPLANLLASKEGAAAHGVTGYGVPIKTCTLWAPACTMKFFEQFYAPVMSRIGQFSIFTLTDRAEQDDNCAGIYNKSLLYLVSNALEDTPHIPGLRDGTPILGMETWLDAALKKNTPLAAQLRKIKVVRSPNTQALDSGRAATAKHHGEFDDDHAVVKSTFIRILGADGAAAQKVAAQKIAIKGSAGSRVDRRHAFNQLFR
ncbi:MAG TPA: C1 family peptidase [Thermoanaerobaculia bacterium]|jgi:hypothetical protein